MLSEGGEEMLSRRFGAGLTSLRLLAGYKLERFRNRNRYVQLTADEYSY